MTKSIAPEGFMELVSTKVGPLKKVRIVSFTGLAAAGGVVNTQFETGFQPVAVIDVTDGSLRTSSFSDTGNTTGQLTQLDTGPNAHIMWAIYTDTGV